MWFSLLVYLMLIKGINAEISISYEDSDDKINVTWTDYIYSEDEVKKHSEVEKTLQHYRQCRNREWSCDKRCRLEFRSETKLCRSPFPGDNCFGIPITYKYTRDFRLVGFPRELAVLSRYPRCWSYLAPIICATIYRPCSRNFYIEKDEQDNVKNGTIELWQLLSLSHCETARKVCIDLVTADLFPSIVKCEVNDSSRPGTSRILYSGACQQGTSQLTLPIRSGVCSWPLVSVPRSMDAHIIPVLDNCFLPCRSPLVPTFLASRFRTVWFVICIILAILFVLESLYLSRFAKSFPRSLLLFFVSHSMISIAIYLIVWSLSVFERFFTLTNCSIDGISRKHAILHSFFEWCSLQSFFLYLSFLSAFCWLFALYIYTIIPASIFEHLVPLRSYVVEFRPLLILFVYGFSAVFSALIMNNLRENDGVSGICHNGLVTSWKYLISLFPLFCLYLVVVAVGIMAVIKKDHFLKAVATKNALCVLNTLEEGEYHRRLDRSRNYSNEIKPKESSEVNKHSSNCETVSENVDLFSRNKPIELVRIDSNWKETYDGLLSKDYLQQIFNEEYKKSYHTLLRHISSERNFGLSAIWTVTSFVFLTVFLLTSPVIHYHRFNISHEQEIKSIVEYINCETANVLTNGSVNEQLSDIWPPTATIDTSSCLLPLIEAQKRLESVCIVFVILPALPFIILLFAFLKGAGKNDGNNANAMISKSRDNDEEYVHLVSIGNEKCVPVESIETANVNNDSNGNKEIHREADAFLKHGNDFHVRASDETRNGPFTVDRENLNEPEASEGSKDANEASQEGEYQDVLSSIINQVRGELAFQQSMLVSDNAAWNICLFYMQKFEECLSSLSGHMDLAKTVNQDLQHLSEEMSLIVPVVSDHAVQLWRWINSVQQASMKLDHLQGITHDNGRFRSLFESQDISRQRNLLSISSHLLQSHQHKKQNPLEISFLPADSHKQVITQPTCPLDEKLQGETSTNQHIQNGRCVSTPSTSSSLDKKADNSHERRGSIGHGENVALNHQIANNAGHNSSVVNGDSNQGVSNRRSHQIQRSQAIPRISAYAVSYSATPRGIFTRLSLPELRLRVQQIKNICAGDNLYPQELSYMLLVTGDIMYGGGQLKEGQSFYTVEQLPGIFGTRVPTIDARVGVQDFLTQMRRRALTVVGAVGYHYSFHTAGGTSYTPPVLPPLGLYRSENELVLRRVLGDRDDVLLVLRDFLKEFQFGRGPVNPRPDLRLAFSFRNYLAMVATREGFNNDHYEEYITDPIPPLEAINGMRGNENSVRENGDEADPSAP